MRQRGGEQEVTGFKGTVLAEAQDSAIRLVVVSVDGQTDNVVDRVLDLPSQDYKEIIAAINEVTEGKKK
jgi:hypothetical protein